MSRGERQPSRRLNDTAALAFLADKSAHPDVAAALIAAVNSLGDVQVTCPDWNACRYVATSTQGALFGFAFGMNSVAFRLAPPLQERALATGAAPLPECGPDWVSFILFRDDWPAVDLPFWARKAYLHARTAP